MYYMAMNPSNSKFNHKLIQSCKYFFERNPILVVRKMEEISICSNEDCTAYSYDDAPCCVKIDIKKIKSKFWLTQKLMADYLRMDESPNITFTSLLCPKLFRCEIDDLRICDKIVLFEDFKYLASFATYVTLSNVKMIHRNGKVVMLEKILEAITNIEKFIW
uniref:Uncharacterized protein n=1 Tax=Panagrolaimus davidi TaxID=227884 RepID=A0A914P863_9BILA